MQWPHPSTLNPIEITPAEAVVLFDAANSGGVTYNTGARGDRSRANLYARMAQRHLVVFTDAKAGGWTPGMWSAHLTVIGWNAAFRWDSGDPERGAGDRHVGLVDLYARRRTRCGGRWAADGTCEDCGATRPLDAAAYDDYLDALSPAARETEGRAPRLWCAEHGRMRSRDITTAKVCLLPGTDYHDGGLDRI